MPSSCFLVDVLYNLCIMKSTLSCTIQCLLSLQIYNCYSLCVAGTKYLRLCIIYKEHLLLSVLESKIKALQV